jgi:hypothetical protein
MKILRYIFSLFRLRRPTRPEDIPKLLTADALSQAMEEARRLHAQHQVDVHPLAPGELPIPRRAEKDH